MLKVVMLSITMLKVVTLSFPMPKVVRLSVPVRGARYLTGDNLEVVRAEFSTLS